MAPFDSAKKHYVKSMCLTIFLLWTQLLKQNKPLYDIKLLFILYNKFDEAKNCSMHEAYAIFCAESYAIICLFVSRTFKQIFK